MPLGALALLSPPFISPSTTPLLHRALSQVLLDTQYRMSPLISAFASRTFYSSRLRDGPNVLDPARAPLYLRDNRDMRALADRGDHGDNEEEEDEEGEGEAEGLWGGYKRPRRAVDRGYGDDDDGTTGSRELGQLMVFNLLSSRDSSSASASSSSSSSYSSTVVAAASSFAGAVASASALWGHASEPSQGASSEPSQNTTASTSLSNVEEATLCVRLLQVRIFMRTQPAISPATRHLIVSPLLRW